MKFHRIYSVPLNLGRHINKIEALWSENSRGLLSYLDKKDAWAQGFSGDISGVQLSLFSRFASWFRPVCIWAVTGPSYMWKPKPLQCNGFGYKMTPPILNNDNSLFRSGRVIHFGTPGWIRTSGLQSRSYQAVKGKTVVAQGFQLGCTNFPPFIENSRSHCGAMAPGILQIVVK